MHLLQVCLARCTIGIYHSAISGFLEPHGLYKASNHTVISKLIHHFYLQCSPCKNFDPGMLSIFYFLLERWAPASSLTTFKLSWKTATLLALVTVKHCSDLTVLCIDNQYPFLSVCYFHSHVWWQDSSSSHLPPQICIKSHSNVIFSMFFIWRLIWDVLNHLGWSQMDCMWPLFFWVTIASTGLSVLKPFLLW